MILGQQNQKNETNDGLLVLFTKRYPARLLCRCKERRAMMDADEVSGWLFCVFDKLSFKMNCKLYEVEKINLMC